MVDELDRRSISSALEYKIKVMKEAQREEQDMNDIEFKFEDETTQLHKKLLKSRTEANSFSDQRQSLPDVTKQSNKKLSTKNDKNGTQMVEIEQLDGSANEKGNFQYTEGRSTQNAG